jgi:hypothetical protein
MIVAIRSFVVVMLALGVSCASAVDGLKYTNVGHVLLLLKPYGFIPIQTEAVQHIFEIEHTATNKIPYYRLDRTVAAYGIEGMDPRSQCFVSFEPSQDEPRMFDTLRVGCAAESRNSAVQMVKSWLDAVDPQLLSQFETAANEPETPSSETRKILAFHDRDRVVSIETKVFANQRWHCLLVFHEGEPLIYVH